MAQYVLLIYPIHNQYSIKDIITKYYGKPYYNAFHHAKFQILPNNDVFWLQCGCTSEWWAPSPSFWSSWFWSLTLLTLGTRAGWGEWRKGRARAGIMVRYGPNYYRAIVKGVGTFCNIKHNVHRFTLNLHGLKIMMIESFPQNIFCWRAVFFYRIEQCLTNYMNKTPRLLGTHGSYM